MNQLGSKVLDARSNLGNEKLIKDKSFKKILLGIKVDSAEAIIKLPLSKIK